MLWLGVDHVRAMAREKAEAERELADSRAMAERITLAKEETDRQARREWHSAYALYFDYYCRFEGDVRKARNEEIPWLDLAWARILAEPARLELTSLAGTGQTRPPGPGLGFPLVLPREMRAVAHFRAPPGKAGELIVHIGVDRDYRPKPDSLALRLGPVGRPGASFHRGETVLAEDPAFALRSDAVTELVIERADGRLAAFIDGEAALEVGEPPPSTPEDAQGDRIAVEVRDGSLSFFDFSLETRGLSRHLAAGLMDIANNMSEQGRPDLAFRLYAGVLTDPVAPAEPAYRLRALRAWSRLVWLSLPPQRRNADEVLRNCGELFKQMPTGRDQPGGSDFLFAISLANQPRQAGETASLERFERAAAAAYSSGNSEYGDLARFEDALVRLRLGMTGEAVKRLIVMIEDGSIARLRDRLGPELVAGGRMGLLLKKAESVSAAGEDSNRALGILRTAAAASPGSREAAAGLRRLALIRAAAGDAAGSLEAILLARNTTPDWPAAYLDEALFHWRLDRPDLAEKALALAAEAMPQSLDRLLGEARLRLDEAPEKFRDSAAAEEASRAAVELSEGKNPQALELLARALERQGETEPAGRFIQAALALELTDERLQLAKRLALPEPAPLPAP
jgi:tetratricopeptide (TPR) repeat protein